MNSRDVERMPYGLAATALLVGAPLGFLWLSATEFEGVLGFAAGVAVGVLVIVANRFWNRLMIQKKYREESERRPASLLDWGWLAVLVCVVGGFAYYSSMTAAAGYLLVLLAWYAEDIWSRRNLSK